MDTSRSNMSSHSTAASTSTFVVEYGDAAFRPHPSPPVEYSPSDWLVSPMGMSVSRVDSNLSATHSAPPTPNDRERPPVQRSLTTGNGGAHHAPRNVQYQSGAPVTQPRPTGGIKGYYALVNGGAPPPQRAGTSHPTAGLSGYASTQISLAQTYNGRGNLAPRNEPEHSPGGYASQGARLQPAIKTVMGGAATRPRSVTPHGGMVGRGGGYGGGYSTRGGGVSSAGRPAPAASILERIRSRKGGARGEPYIARPAGGTLPTRGRGGGVASRGRGVGALLGGSEFSHRLQGLMLVRDQMEHLATAHKDEEARLRELLLELLPSDIRSAVHRVRHKAKGRHRHSSNDSSSSSTDEEGSAHADTQERSLGRPSHGSTRPPQSKSRTPSSSSSGSSTRSSSVASVGRLIKERDDAIKLLENFQEQGNKVISTLHAKLKESNQENVRQLQDTERLKQENARLRELLIKVSHAPTLSGSPTHRGAAGVSESRRSNPVRLVPKDGGLDGEPIATNEEVDGVIAAKDATIAQQSEALEQHLHTIQEQEGMLEKYDALMRESDEAMINLRTENEDMARELKELRARLDELYGSGSDEGEARGDDFDKEGDATWLHDPSSASSLNEEAAAAVVPSAEKDKRAKNKNRRPLDPADQRRSMHIVDILVKELRAEKTQRLASEEHSQQLMAQHQRHVVLLEQRLSKLMKQLYGGNTSATGSTILGSTRGASVATGVSSTTAVDDVSSLNTARSEVTLYTCSAGLRQSPRSPMNSSAATPTHPQGPGSNFSSCMSSARGNAKEGDPPQGEAIGPLSPKACFVAEDGGGMSPMLSSRSQASSSVLNSTNPSLDMEGALSPFQQRRRRRDESLQRHSIAVQLGQAGPLSQSVPPEHMDDGDVRAHRYAGSALQHLADVEERSLSSTRNTIELDETVTEEASPAPYRLDSTAAVVACVGEGERVEWEGAPRAVQIADVLLQATDPINAELEEEIPSEVPDHEGNDDQKTGDFAAVACDESPSDGDAGTHHDELVEGGCPQDAEDESEVEPPVPDKQLLSGSCSDEDGRSHGDAAASNNTAEAEARDTPPHPFSESSHAHNILPVYVAAPTSSTPSSSDGDGTDSDGTDDEALLEEAALVARSLA